MLAEDAPLEPENVQLVALFARFAFGASVTAGSAIGDANAHAAKAVTTKALRIFGIAIREV